MDAGQEPRLALVAAGSDARGQPAKRTLRLRLAAAVLALTAGALLAEGLLRWLVFSPSLLATRLGERFRDPSLYVASPGSDDQAKLVLRLSVGWRARHGIPPGADAELGWLKPEIEPGTYRHEDEDALAGRRPVLLYGSSYAACHGLDEGCFDQLLEASEAGARHALLNYGVSGHGLDQMLLLLQHSVDRFAVRDPIVVVALVVETDLDRATHSFFTRPKPRFRAAEGGFVLELPDELDVLGYLERHPPTIRSYLWRYLLTAVGVPGELRRRWEGEPERVVERFALTDFLLGEVARECQARGLEHFVLLFHTAAALEAPPDPDEERLHELLERHGLPWIDTRALVERARAERALSLRELYGPSAHPSGLGTLVLFDALVRGLNCDFDGGDGP